LIKSLNFDGVDKNNEVSCNQLSNSFCSIISSEQRKRYKQKNKYNKTTTTKDKNDK
jgi:hypothetical protein